MKTKLILILLVISLFLISGCSSIKSKLICEKWGGTWIEKGTDKECMTIEKGCESVNPNCQTVFKGGPAGTEGSECRHIATCKCQEREGLSYSYSSDKGCIYHPQK